MRDRNSHCNDDDNLYARLHRSIERVFLEPAWPSDGYNDKNYGGLVVITNTDSSVDG